MAEPIEHQNEASKSLVERLEKLYLTGREIELKGGCVLSLRPATQREYLAAIFAQRAKHEEEWELAATPAPAGAEFDFNASTPEERTRFSAMALVTMETCIATLRACCEELAEGSDRLLEAVLTENGGPNGELARACSEMCGTATAYPGQESDPFGLPSDSAET